MTKPATDYDIARLRLVVAYDAATGALTWATDGRHRRAGAVAGHVSMLGYHVVNVPGYRTLKAHRVAWALTHGEWPSAPIDHINGDKRDNRLCNLRLVDGFVNAQNLRRPHVDNSTGLLGVTRARNGRFRAKLKADGRYLHIGIFPTADEAHCAYLAAKRLHHAGCTL